MSIRLLTGLMLVAVRGSAVSAQDTPRLEVLRSAQDTVRAIDSLERLARRDFRNPAYHYLLGRLYFGQYEPGMPVSEARRNAEEHARLATRFGPDSAKHWLLLAHVLRTQTEVTVRAQVPGLLNRAVDAARTARSPDLSQALYWRGRLRWEQYEQQADRHRLTASLGDIDHDAFLNDWQYVEMLFGGRLRPEFGGMVEWSRAVRDLAEAFAQQPGAIDVAGLLVVALGAQHKWDSAGAIARQLVETLPDSGRAWALLGLTAARRDRWADAQAAFDSAFVRFPPHDLAPYHHLPLILPPADEGAFTTAADPEAVRTLYWRRWDPLWLTAEHEPRTEFYARVTAADHRWADPLRGYRGWESERGAVYVRYGPPDLHATLAPGGVDLDRVVVVRGRHRDPARERIDAAERLDRERVRMLWVYLPSQLRFIFSVAQGYARAQFAGAARHAFEVARERDPVRYDNVPLPVIDSIALRVAQFRAAADGPAAVAVYGEGEALAWARDETRILGISDTGTSFTTGHLIRQFADPAGILGTIELPPGPGAVRIEWLGDGEGARGAQVLTVRPPVAGDPSISDLLLARRVSDTVAAARWYELPLHPVTNTVRGDSLVLAWESYGLPSDSGGRTVSYAVEVRFQAESLARRGLFARVVGGIGDALGLTAEGDDVAAFRFARSVPARGDGAYLDWLAVDVSAMPAGSYQVETTITDVAGRSVSSGTQVAIVR